MSDIKEWYVKASDAKVYGPASSAQLVEWVRDGRIEPASLLSRDRISWVPAQTLECLEMKWIVETVPGKLFGPFNRALVIQLQNDGKMPQGAKLYRMHELRADEDVPPVVKEVKVEVPVEKIVEKVVVKEVPVEKIVEKIVEVEPPPRQTVVTEVVEDPVGSAPPLRLNGIFKDVSSEKLKALEAAAQREIAVAGKRRFGGLFGRR